MFNPNDGSLTDGSATYMGRSHLARILFGVLLLASVLLGSARAAELTTGVIVLNPAGVSVAEQDAIISQLKAAGVHLIRTGMGTDDVRVDFAKRAFAQGIKIDALIEPQFPPAAVKQLQQSGDYSKIWGGLPLAAIDPAASKAYFQTLIQKLESAGVVLAGLELGNEINWAGFPQKISNGRTLDLNDLSGDPLGQQVAAGFRKYLQILTVLKDVRDHSRLNARTPIISAGLSPVGPAGTQPNFFTTHGFSVTASATLSYLRANGLDNLVDAYGIHYYPRENNPDARRMRMDTYAVSECRPAQSAAGKPCWITEWGVDNNDRACPLDDRGRAVIIQETMNNFRDLARQGRLLVVLYYSWNSPPGSAEASSTSIFRCGKLTEAGRLALIP